MSRWHGSLTGSVDDFAIDVTFADDPDEGRFADRSLSSSWGSLRLYVRGRELTCAVGPQGEEEGGVWWYLLPIFEWLTTHWDALLNEPRFPLSVPGNTAAAQISRAACPPPGVDDADRWRQSAWGFYERHALVSARDGGIFPNVVFRRSGESVEISWLDNDRPGGGPLQFTHEAGAELVPVHTFASVWRDTLLSSVVALRKRFEGPRLAALADAIAGLEHPDVQRKRTRSAWLLGLRERPEATLDLWDSLHAKGVTIELPDNSPLFCRASLPAVLFASLRPDLSVDDVASVSTLFSKMRPMSAKLAHLARHEPCPTFDAFKSGYALALQVRELLDLGDEPLDVPELMKQLDLGVEPLAIAASGVRGLSLVHGDSTVIAYNAKSKRAQRSWSRAAVVAHELCHVLFDRNLGTDLAIGSGPWAPRHVEQRANAFAAMFLMPEGGIAHVLEGCSSEPRERVAAVAKRFGASYRAATEHLYSLGLLDEDARDDLLDELDELLVETGD